MACTRLQTKADRGAPFSLTAKIEGVKTNSFFDSFWSFPGWRGVRGSSQGHDPHRKVMDRGSVRVYSKALVEANRKI